MRKPSVPTSEEKKEQRKCFRRMNDVSSLLRRAGMRRKGKD